MLKRFVCWRIRRKGWRYLDNTLTPPQRAKVEAHLALCPHCRAEYMRRAQILESLLKGVPVGAALRERPHHLGIGWVFGGLLAIGLGTAFYLLQPQVGVEWNTLIRHSPSATNRSSNPEPPPPAAEVKANVPIGSTSPTAVANPSRLSTTAVQPRLIENVKSIPPGTGDSAPTRPIQRPKKKPAVGQMQQRTPQGSSNMIEIYDESGRLIKRWTPGKNP